MNQMDLQNGTFWVASIGSVAWRKGGRVYLILALCLTPGLQLCRRDLLGHLIILRMVQIYKEIFGTRQSLICIGCKVTNSYFVQHTARGVSAVRNCRFGCQKTG